MNAARFLALMGRRRLAFKASAVTAAGTTTVVKPAGLALGDLLLVICLQSGGSPTISTSGGAAWTTVTHQPSGSGDRYAVHWKIADAADVSNAITVSANPGISSGLISASYTGGTGALTEKTVLNTGAPSSTTATFTGYTPSGVSLGAICVFIDEVENQTPTAPAGFTVRRHVSGGGNCSADLADNTYYAGAAVSWTGSSTQCKYGILLEVS